MSFDFIEIILAFIVVITVIVFVHEMGHYLLARWSGVHVEIFSVGFGRELFGYTDRLGTRWRVSILPLGGYVKMLGDADAASAKSVALTDIPDTIRAKSLPAQKLRYRAAIVAAGPAFNFLFAMVLLAVIYVALGEKRIVPVVASIAENSAAAKSDIQPGDRIIAIDQQPIDQVETILALVTPNPGKPITMTVDRNGQKIQVNLTLSEVAVADPDGVTRKIGRIGISFAHDFVKVSVFEAIPRAVTEVGIMAWQIVDYLKQLITGDRSPRDLGGLISIAELSGQAAKLGLAEFSLLLVVLSINLGVINLLPIPVLDGGHLMLYAIEAVRGRPLSERAQNMITTVGFIAVLLLMVVANGNDIYNKLRNLSYLFH
ncbi:MAG: RIP metalloprotease RseP [Candidatus Symbiobacter sp.]|nr:RIP metalloprotease RseP [Candidatus Symbiobacter sp.]